jgi:hypothetical protein
MKNQHENKERGIALLLCILALFILSGIAASLLISSGTEGNINQNYRSEEVAFFAAKSGIYEALDRMQQSSTASIAAQVPTSAPSATGGVLYLINAGASLTVQPWTASNTYFDTEFCHEGYTIAGMTATTTELPCASVPSGTYYTSVNAVNTTDTWSGTKAAIPYQWVRINWKQNNTQTYLSGTAPATPVTANYSVNSTGLPGTAGTSVCLNTLLQEVLLPAGNTSCENYPSCASTSASVHQPISMPVMMVTALAVTPNGSRHMVQAEAALSPTTVTIPLCGTSTVPGFFAYSSASTCNGAMSDAFIIGGNATVDGYNSNNGVYSNSNKQASLGNIGTDGGTVQNGNSVTVGGSVYVPSNPPGPGPCPALFQQNGGTPTSATYLSTVIPRPTVTTPAAGTTNESPDHSHQILTLTPGNYGNLSVGSGYEIVLTAPGTYNVACISANSSGSNITISPSNQAVTINVNPPVGSSCYNNPINFGSNTLINNSSEIAENLKINYAGTGRLDFTGGASTAAIINAPNAAVVLHGGSDFFGSIGAATIDDSGGVNLHFDSAAQATVTQAATTATWNQTGSYNILSFHSLPY